MTDSVTVHQFHSGTAPGDAVTQQMLDLRGRLRALGHPSEIFAEHIHPALSGEISSIFDYQGDPNHVLLVHHSMGYDAFERVLALPDRVAAVYHNITPAEFFRDEGTRRYARLGRHQLRRLARRASAAIADSNFNRREMLDAGFTHVRVLPVRTNFAAFEEMRQTSSRGSSDWIYVGRIVPNKCQHQIVDAFAEYRDRFSADAHLHLLGDQSHREYAEFVRDRARRAGIDDAVHMPGKVSEHELRRAYASAGLFVSLSEHEGFGVPLLEAMAAGLPVVAFSSSAVKETMGGGMVLTTKEPSRIAALAHLLDTDIDLRTRLIEHQDRRLRRITEFDVEGVLEDTVVDCVGGPPPVTSVQIQGPFETSYSLAILNRELALHLDERPQFDVSIYATEGPGDYVPKPEDLAEVPDAKKLYERAADVPFPDVVIRQMYPPRVDDSPGALTFQYFGWEETGLPAQYVADFNQHLDGIGVMSSYVRDLLVDAGVHVPIAVVGVGVREPRADATVDAPELSDLRPHRFLHVSSAFPRKGIDVLLDAYFAEFDGDSDTTLILKTFPNIHNETAVQLASARERHANPPDVRWIDRDMTDDELDALYGLATAYVHPARGEGFGLPVAEAMLAGVPVIAPASTGLADLVSTETAVVIPHTLQPARTHLSTGGSLWAEPDRDALARSMRWVIDHDNRDAVTAMTERAEAHVRRNFNWDAVAERWTRFIADVGQMRRRPRVAMVTTWNSRCGIAENSRFIVEHLGRRAETSIFADRHVEPVHASAERSIARVWAHRWSPDLSTLSAAVDEISPDVVHVQFNFGFFELGHLTAFIEQQQGRGRPVVVSLHRTLPLAFDDEIVDLAAIAPDLASVARLIVHQEADAEYLASIGVVDNVEVVPLGAPAPPTATPAEVRHAMRLTEGPLLGTFGFLLPHKGTLALLEATRRLLADHPQLKVLCLCARHPDQRSAAYEAECRAFIAEHGLEDAVLLVTDFLDDALARTLLRGCDIVAMPYLDTEESSSATLRFVLPAERPIVATDLAIFRDARESLSLIRPGDVDQLVDRLDELIRSPEQRDELAAATRRAARKFSWDRVATRHAELYVELANMPRAPDHRNERVRDAALDQGHRSSSAASGIRSAGR